MGLKEVAEDALMEGDDFKFYGFTGDGLPIVNNFWYTENTPTIKAEYFRRAEKVRYSLKIDGQEIPFATVETTKKRLFPDTYKVKVEILPSMIPKALEAMAAYLQTHPVLSGEFNFSNEDRLPYIKRVQAVQKSLNELLGSTLLERKVADAYQQRNVA